MTELEHFRNYAKVVEAWLTGSDIQIKKTGYAWETWTNPGEPDYIPAFRSDNDYRVKPKGRKFKIAIYKSGYCIRTSIVQPAMYSAIETNPNFDYWLDGKEWEIEE